MNSTFTFQLSVVILILLLLGLEAKSDDYIWVVKDPEIQDNIPPPRKAEYEANRDRDEAQETLEAIEAEVRRATDTRR